MASLHTNELLPTSTEEAIRIFDERYRAKVAATQPEGPLAAFAETVSAPRITYPISEFASAFREAKEYSQRTKDFTSKTFDLTVAQYDNGFEVKVLDLLTNEFAAKNWYSAAGDFVRAEAQHVNDQLATLLEAGTSTLSPWDDVNFFSASHKANPFVSGSATWSNYQSSTKDPASVANITAEITAMKGVLDVNGKKMRVTPDQIWVPSEKFQYVSNLINQNFLATGESNPIAGKLQVIEISELTDVNDWFLVDSKLAARLNPMIAAKFNPGGPLGLITFDENSDFFKDTKKIKKSVSIWYGFKLIFPHAIRLVKGA